jgi:hypothetical protein
MPELTAGQIADLRAGRDHCVALGADLVIIGAIAYQVHFPGELRHTGDIDFAVALDLNEFAELERRLRADGWIRFANREHGGAAHGERLWICFPSARSFAQPSK